MGERTGSTRVPSVVAYAVLLGVLLVLYRCTPIGLDRVPERVACPEASCGGGPTVLLARAEASPAHLLVPVTLRGVPLLMLLDTGAESTVIARAAAQARGWLADTRTIVGAVNERVGRQHVLPIEALGVGDRAFGGFDATVIDLAGVRAGLGPRVEGVLGADVLGVQPFEIDFARPSLRLGRDAAAFAAARGPGERDTPAALVRIGGGYYVETRAGDREALFLIDSGSNVSQVAEPVAAEIGGVQETRGRAFDAGGAAAPRLRTLALPILAVGDVGRRDVVVTVGPESLLGADFFAGWRLRVDPVTDTLTLRTPL